MLHVKILKQGKLSKEISSRVNSESIVTNIENYTFIGCESTTDGLDESEIQSNNASLIRFDTINS